MPSQAISTLEEQIQTLQAKLSVLGLNMPALRNAICTDMNAAAQPWCPTVIATLGSGPWEASEYDYFLQDRAFEPVEAPHTGVDGLIVGANDWSADVLSRQIYDRDSSTLRVYTQELFVVGMVIGEDPYDALDQEAIEEIANSHPAIQFILARDFSWPVATQEVFHKDDMSGTTCDATTGVTIHEPGSLCGPVGDKLSQCLKSTLRIR